MQCTEVFTFQLPWIIILSTMSFIKVIVVIIWLIFMIFSLIRPLEMLAMEMTSFKSLEWLIWLLHNFHMSCFIGLSSSSFAVPNKKWNSLPKGNRDVLILMSLCQWMWPIRLKVSIWVEVISFNTELISFKVIFKRKEYL